MERKDTPPHLKLVKREQDKGIEKPENAAKRAVMERIWKLGEEFLSLQGRALVLAKRADAPPSLRDVLARMNPVIQSLEREAFINAGISDDEWEAYVDERSGLR